MHVPAFQSVYFKKGFDGQVFPQAGAGCFGFRRNPQGWVFCTYKEHLLSSSSSIYVFVDLFIEIIVPGSQSQEREVFKALVGGVIYDVLRYL